MWEVHIKFRYSWKSLIVGVFDIYKSTGVIDGFGGEDIDISGEKGWPSRLIIQNCPNLKSVDCSDLIDKKSLNNVKNSNSTIKYII